MAVSDAVKDLFEWRQDSSVNKTSSIREAKQATKTGALGWIASFFSAMFTWKATDQETAVEVLQAKHCCRYVVEDTDERKQAVSRELLQRVKSEAIAPSFQFVEALPEEILSECAICLGVLKEPHIVGCCGNRFCKKCINSVLWARKPCPLCMSKYFQNMPDVHLQRLLSQRKHTERRRLFMDWRDG